MLACQDPAIINICLEGLENILRVGEAEKNAGLTDANVYVNQIDDAGGLDKIEDLQSHENIQIYEKTVQIAVNYLADDDEDEMEYLADDEMVATFDLAQTAFDFCCFVIGDCEAAKGLRFSSWLILSTSHGPRSEKNQNSWLRWCHLAMGYNFDFFNFIIMTSCCHMSTQIQIPNSKVYIIFYPPISCLQK